MLLLGSIRSTTIICIRTDNVFFRKPTRPSLPLRKAPPLISVFSPQGREDVTALRSSEPLRSKVGGASKSSPYCVGWDRMGKGGGEGDKSGMLLKPYNKYRTVSYELDAYERKK